MLFVDNLKTGGALSSATLRSEERTNVSEVLLKVLSTIPFVTVFTKAKVEPALFVSYGSPMDM